MTKRDKGNAFVRWCKAWLVAQGWKVHVYGHTARFIGNGKYVSQDQDVWGCDLQARKGHRLLHIQATLDSAVQKRLDEFQKYFADGFLPGEDVQVWMKTTPGIVNVHSVVIGVGTNGKLFDSMLGKIIRGKFISSEKEGPFYEF